MFLSIYRPTLTALPSAESGYRLLKTAVRVALVTAILMVGVLPAGAQVSRGRLDVAVSDGAGAGLPGVTVEVAGPQAGQSVTNEKGQASFVGLEPGRYAAIVQVPGRTAWRSDDVPVTIGSVVRLKVTMAVGEAVAELTFRTHAEATTVSLDALQAIPTARDPWVVLQTVPGVLVDRVNVGGSESGQQSVFMARGASSTDNTWSLDGVAITDMAELGVSPTYYDFDMFQEIRVATGGADVSTPTSGVQLSLALRSGTSIWRGSSRYYFENGRLQSDNLSGDLRGTLASYNRVASYRDYGLELGGPLVKGRVFAWGAFGRTEPEVNVHTLGAGTYEVSARNRTTLENASAKVTAHIDANTRSSVTVFSGDKRRMGRGASAIRSPETTWNQKTPFTLLKVGLSRTFGNSMFLTGRYAKVSNAFSLLPQGGPDTGHYRDDAGVHHGSYVSYRTDRPQHTVNVEGTVLTRGHDVSVGFGYRLHAESSQSAWPGTGIQTRHTTYPRLTAVVVRDWATESSGEYWSGYVGDTVRRGRLTINAGVRWDRSASSIDEASVPASTVLPNLLPALNAPAVRNAIVWNTISPRAAVAFAFDESRKTVARVSYSMFASQLDSNRASLIASAIPDISYVFYGAIDTNANNVADPAEIAVGTFLGTAGFDPTNPTKGNPDSIGEYQSPKTQEVTLGFDRTLGANLDVSATVTVRRSNNFNWLHPRGVTGTAFNQTSVLTGATAQTGTYAIPVYSVSSSALPEDGGRVFEKRDGYAQQYWGVELTATKRMSNRWMLRAGFSTGEHTERFADAAAQFDPTATLPQAGVPLASPNVSGGPVLTVAPGNGNINVYLAAPKFQYTVTSAYQARFGVNLGLSYLGREGTSAPYFLGAASGSEDALHSRGRNILVANLESSRLPVVHVLDVRASKSFGVNRLMANLDLDVFNLLNAATVLGRQFDLNAINPNQPLEVLNPRIIRLGLRLRF